MSILSSFSSMRVVHFSYKIGIFLLFAIFFLNAHSANWIEVDVSVTPNTRELRYINIESLRRSDKFIVYKNRLVANWGSESTIEREVFADCSGKRRFEVISNNDLKDMPFRSVYPNTPAGNELKKACEHFSKLNNQNDTSTVLIASSDREYNSLKPVSIKNSVNLSYVDPLEWNFIYSIPNQQACEPNMPRVKCISYNDYKASCHAAKNISWQAVSGSMYIDEGLPRRLLERFPKYSNINIYWRDNKCLFSYEIWANFQGKVEGCRHYGLAAGFALTSDQKIVINHAVPLRPDPGDSTCRLN